MTVRERKLLERGVMGRVYRSGLHRLRGLDRDSRVLSGGIVGSRGFVELLHGVSSSWDLRR